MNKIYLNTNFSLTPRYAHATIIQTPIIPGLLIKHTSLFKRLDNHK